MGYSNDRVLIHAGLFLLCALLSALGVGALALWCFLPAAAAVEAACALDARARRADTRRM